MSFKERIVDWMVKSKKYLVSLGWLGAAGLILWWIIKILICFFTGICIIV